MNKQSATYRNFLSDREYLKGSNCWLRRTPSPTEKKLLEAAGYTDFNRVDVHRCGDVFIQFGATGDEVEGEYE